MRIHIYLAGFLNNYFAYQLLERSNVQTVAGGFSNPTGHRLDLVNVCQIAACGSKRTSNWTLLPFDPNVPAVTSLFVIPVKARSITVK